MRLCYVMRKLPILLGHYFVYRVMIYVRKRETLIKGTDFDFCEF